MIKALNSNQINVSIQMFESIHMSDYKNKTYFDYKKIRILLYHYQLSVCDMISVAFEFILMENETESGWKMQKA
jgi:hypothetical protein